MATGWIRNRLSSSLYFAVLVLSARDATPPAARADRYRCDGARVSQTVASQINDFSDFQGEKVWPSGRGAFNTLRRDLMLESVHSSFPTLFPMIDQAHQHPTILFWENQAILSRNGVQQGDPCGPALFCIALHRLLSSLESEFKPRFLDDGTLGGTVRWSR